MAIKPDIRPRKPSGRRRTAPGEEWLATRPGSPLWHYDFSIDGDRFRGGCGTANFEAACQFAVEERDKEWRRIKLGEKPATRLTLNDAFSRWWLDRGKGTKYGEVGQRHQLARILRILGSNTGLHDLDNATIARLVRGLRAGEGVNEGHEARGLASPATVNRYLATLSVICAWARDVEGCDVGQWEKKKHRMSEPEGRERFLTHEVGGALLAAIVPHAKAPIAFGLLTGVRKAGNLGLQWEQITLELGRVLLNSKGGKPIMLTLAPPAVRLLTMIQPDPEKRQGDVWTYGAVPCSCAHCSSPRYRGNPIRDVKRSFKTAARKVGAPDARIHDLRHSFASWLLAATGDLKLVQEALHHSDIQTTTRYARLLPGRKEAGIAAAVAGLMDEQAPQAALPAPVKKEAG